MTTIDRTGLAHRPAGTPDGGQFTTKTNSAPAGVLTADPQPNGIECGECGGELDSVTTTGLCADCSSGLLCPACGLRNDDGEGFDGYCGSCADRRTCPHCGEGKDADDVTCGERECKDAQFEADREARAQARKAEAAKWGETGLREGARTPWGAADHVEERWPGIAMVSTPGHGGIKLSPERQKAIPAALRRQGGWYEEDVEANIVAAVFPAELYLESGSEEDREVYRKTAEAAIRNWLPSEYETWKGVTLQPGESAIKDQRLYEEAHKADFMVRSAISAESTPGMVRVSALRASDGAEAEYLVPTDEYRAHRLNGSDGVFRAFVVDPKRHPRLPDKVAAEKPAPSYVHALPNLGAMKLTPAARQRVDADLSKRYNFSGDVGVMTVGEYIAAHGLTDRTVYVDGTRREYSLRRENENGAGAITFKVSKATWDAFAETVPDKRSPADVAYQEWSIERAKRSKSTSRPRDAFEARRRQQEAEARDKELYERYTQLRIAEEAANGQANAYEKAKADYIAREQAARIEENA